VGEFLQSILPLTGISFPPDVMLSIGSLTVPPGDWEVWARICISQTDSMPRELAGFISGPVAPDPTNPDPETYIGIVWGETDAYFPDIRGLMAMETGPRRYLITSPVQVTLWGTHYGDSAKTIYVTTKITARRMR
jgi:hypothetical protein